VRTASSSRSNSASLIALSHVRERRVSKLLLSPIEAITQIVSIGLPGQTWLMKSCRRQGPDLGVARKTDDQSMPRRHNFRDTQGQLPIAGGAKKPVETFIWPQPKPQICHNILIRFQFISKARMLPRLAIRFPVPISMRRHVPRASTGL